MKNSTHSVKSEDGFNEKLYGGSSIGKLFGGISFFTGLWGMISLFLGQWMEFLGAMIIAGGAAYVGYRLSGGAKNPELKRLMRK